MAEYRRRFTTLYDRADLYIPFIEHSLNSLAKGGSLGFICSDRWMKNKYGGPLRAMIAQNYHLKAYVDMVDTDAFHSEVIAYPAITIISCENPGISRKSAGKRSLPFPRESYPRNCLHPRIGLRKSLVSHPGLIRGY